MRLSTWIRSSILLAAIPLSMQTDCCNAEELEKDQIEILDVDSDGRVFARKLTAAEIKFIDGEDAKRKKLGLPPPDGEVNNKSSEPILAYGPKPSADRKHDNAIYLLPPGKETVEPWDFDGIYIPGDRNVSGNSASPPYAAKITDDEFGTVKAVTNTSYEISVVVGKFDVLREKTIPQADGELRENWLVPFAPESRISQSQIKELAEGKRIIRALPIK